MVPCVLLIGLLNIYSKLLHGNRSSSQVPRLVLPDELFVGIGRTVGAEVNQCIQYLQDVACQGNLKQFLVVGSQYFPSTLPLTTYACKLNVPC